MILYMIFKKSRQGKNNPSFLKHFMYYNFINVLIKNSWFVIFIKIKLQIKIYKKKIHIYTVWKKITNT